MVRGSERSSRSLYASTWLFWRSGSICWGSTGRGAGPPSLEPFEQQDPISWDLSSITQRLDLYVVPA